MFAVLVDDEKKNNRWDAKEFFTTGRIEVDAVLASTEGLGLKVRRGSALDFGCGLGRLTQALCSHFAECTGVDISDSMIERARALNQVGDRCSYVVNKEPHLHMLPDDSFDFIYTSIVLQHIPALLGRGYIAELLRVLRPQGVAVFDCPTGPRQKASARQRVQHVGKEGFRAIVNGVGGLMGAVPFPRMEMHGIAQADVEAIVLGSGCRLVQTRAAEWHPVPGWETFTYTVTKEHEQSGR